MVFCFFSSLCFLSDGIKFKLLLLKTTQLHSLFSIFYSVFVHISFPLSCLISSEVKDELSKAVEECGANLRVVNPYYPQGAGILERGQRLMKDALVKMCGENGSK